MITASGHRDGNKDTYMCTGQRRQQGDVYVYWTTEDKTQQLVRARRYIGRQTSRGCMLSWESMPDNIWQL